MLKSLSCCFVIILYSKILLSILIRFLIFFQKQKFKLCQVKLIERTYFSEFVKWQNIIWGKVSVYHKTRDTLRKNILETFLTEWIQEHFKSGEYKFNNIGHTYFKIYQFNQDTLECLIYRLPFALSLLLIYFLMINNIWRILGWNKPVHKWQFSSHLFIN